MAHAQNGASNLYSLDYIRNIGGKYTFNNPMYLSEDNPKLYNNQPFIFDSLVFVTIQNNSTQTDIYALDLDKRKKYQLTASEESEFSPTVMPDGKHLSMVRVSADEYKRQQLWKIPLNLSESPELILDKVFKVGYHLWLSETEVAMFIVGTPHMLKIFNIETGEKKPVISYIGRCLSLAPNGHLTFVDKANEEQSIIKTYDPISEKFDQITPTLKGAEDYVWTPEGELIMGQGSKLYCYRPKGTKWELLADLSDFGITNITRIAMDEQRIVFVQQDPNK